MIVRIVIMTLMLIVILILMTGKIDYDLMMTYDDDFR